MKVVLFFCALAWFYLEVQSSSASDLPVATQSTTSAPRQDTTGTLCTEPYEIVYTPAQDEPGGRQMVLVFSEENKVAFAENRTVCGLFVPDPATAPPEEPPTVFSSAWVLVKTNTSGVYDFQAQLEEEFLSQQQSNVFIRKYPSCGVAEANELENDCVCSVYSANLGAAVNSTGGNQTQIVEVHEYYQVAVAHHQLPLADYPRVVVNLSRTDSVENDECQLGSSFSLGSDLGVLNGTGVLNYTTSKSSAPLPMSASLCEAFTFEEDASDGSSSIPYPEFYEDYDVWFQLSNDLVLSENQSALGDLIITTCTEYGADFSPRDTPTPYARIQLYSGCVPGEEPFYTVPVSALELPFEERNDQIGGSLCYDSCNVAVLSSGALDPLEHVVVRIKTKDRINGTLRVGFESFLDRNYSYCRSASELRLGEPHPLSLDNYVDTALDASAAHAISRCSNTVSTRNARETNSLEKRKTQVQGLLWAYYNHISPNSSVVRFSIRGNTTNPSKRVGQIMDNLLFAHGIPCKRCLYRGWLCNSFFTPGATGYITLPTLVTQGTILSLTLPLLESQPFSAVLMAEEVTIPDNDVCQSAVSSDIPETIWAPTKESRAQISKNFSTSNATISVLPLSSPSPVNRASPEVWFRLEVPPTQSELILLVSACKNYTTRAETTVAYNIQAYRGSCSALELYDYVLSGTPGLFCNALRLPMSMTKSIYKDSSKLYHLAVRSGMNPPSEHSIVSGELFVTSGLRLENDNCNQPLSIDPVAAKVDFSLDFAGLSTMEADSSHCFLPDEYVNLRRDYYNGRFFNQVPQAYFTYHVRNTTDQYVQVCTNFNPFFVQVSSMRNAAEPENTCGGDWELIECASMFSATVSSLNNQNNKKKKNNNNDKRGASGEPEETEAGDESPNVIEGNCVIVALLKEKVLASSYLKIVVGSAVPALFGNGTLEIKRGKPPVEDLPTTSEPEEEEPPYALPFLLAFAVTMFCCICLLGQTVAIINKVRQQRQAKREQEDDQKMKKLAKAINKHATHAARDSFFGSPLFPSFQEQESSSPTHSETEATTVTDSSSEEETS